MGPSIRTLVVDDDFRVASTHAAYLERVEGFSVVGQAYSGETALAAAAELRPDLVLLDLYLPDIHGLEVLRRLRAGAPAPVDVIVVTAANDTGSVRAAMQGGALQYLLKPFSFAAFRAKLLSYASMRAELSRERADQRRIDRAFGVLRTPAAGPGRAASASLEAVEAVLVDAGVDLSATEVAEQTGMSRASAQRYLSQLLELGRVRLQLRYGSSGRPEHGYRWVGSGAVPDSGSL